MTPRHSIDVTWYFSPASGSRGKLHAEIDSFYLQTTTHVRESSSLAYTEKVTGSNANIPATWRLVRRAVKEIRIGHPFPAGSRVVVCHMLHPHPRYYPEAKIDPDR